MKPHELPACGGCADCAEVVDLSPEEREIAALKARVAELEVTLEMALTRLSSWVDGELAGCFGYDKALAEIERWERVLEAKP